MYVVSRLRLLLFYHVITSEPAQSSYQNSLRDYPISLVAISAIIWHKRQLAILCMKLSRNIVLLICAVVITITSIGMNSFSLFLKPIEAEFGWSRTMVTVPYMVGMLGWGVGGVLFGKLADDYGARRVILGGILLMAAGFFGMSAAQNLWQLSLWYGIMVGLAKGACGLVIISLLVAKHYDAKNQKLAVSVSRRLHR